MSTNKNECKTVTDSKFKMYHVFYLVRLYVDRVCTC